LLNGRIAAHDIQTRTALDASEMQQLRGRLEGQTAACLKLQQFYPFLSEQISIAINTKLNAGRKKLLK